MIAWLLLMQGTQATVGDTVYLERTLGNVGGAVVRPQQWSLGSLGLQLGPADVRQGAAGAVVRYGLVFWYPGEHTLTMPGPVLVRRDGRSDTLPASTVHVSIWSVLPPNARKSTLAPKPPSRPVPLAAETPLPALVLSGAALLGLAMAALRWRRRGRVRPRASRTTGHQTPEVLVRWAAAGEFLAALEGWNRLLARRQASGDSSEATEAQALRADIDATVFSPRGPEYLAGLVERAARLAGK
jgi:hypothetical protein